VSTELAIAIAVTAGALSLFAWYRYGAVGLVGALSAFAGLAALLWRRNGPPEATVQGAAPDRMRELAERRERARVLREEAREAEEAARRLEYDIRVITDLDALERHLIERSEGTTDGD